MIERELFSFELLEPKKHLKFFNRSGIHIHDDLVFASKKNFIITPSHMPSQRKVEY